MHFCPKLVTAARPPLCRWLLGTLCLCLPALAHAAGALPPAPEYFEGAWSYSHQLSSTLSGSRTVTTVQATTEAATDLRLHHAQGGPSDDQWVYWADSGSWQGMDHLDQEQTFDPGRFISVRGDGSGNGPITPLDPAQTQHFTAQLTLDRSTGHFELRVVLKIPEQLTEIDTFDIPSFSDVTTEEFFGLPIDVINGQATRAQDGYVLSLDQTVPTDVTGVFDGDPGHEVASDTSHGFLESAPARPHLQSLTPSAFLVQGGNPVTFTVALQAPAPAGGVVVSLATTSPSLAPVPVTITLPEGLQAASFVIQTQAVASRSEVFISATGPAGDVLSRSLLLQSPSDRRHFSIPSKTAVLGHRG